MAAVRGALSTVASTSFEHAAERAKDFFKEIAKALPSIMQMYHLDDVTTKSQFLGIIAERFRKNAEITNPQVIDILVYKGREELEQILLQHKQRHHLLTKYISPKYEDAGLKELQSTKSDFLSRFYESN